MEFPPRDKNGKSLEDGWKANFGFDFDCLTLSEARYLEKTAHADTIRDPVSEREAKNTGYVDVAVLVSVEGQLQEIKSVTSEPRNAAFDEATKDAVAKWRFTPGLNRCVRPQAAASYRVSFEMADGVDRVRARPLLSPLPIADLRGE